MTPIDIGDLWYTFLTLVNVSQNGQVPPTVFQNWVNSLSVELFREYFNSYELVQQASDELKIPFLQTALISPVAQSYGNYSIIPNPVNYEYFSRMSILRQKDENKCKCGEALPEIDESGKCYGYNDPDIVAMRQKFAANNLVLKPVQLIDNQRWDSCEEHDTKGPTWDAPKITQTAGGFKISPAGVQKVLLDFLATPGDCIFVYTISVDDILIYNKAGSTQLQWSNILKEVFLTRLQKKYGIYVNSGEIYQMGNEDKKQTV